MLFLTKRKNSYCFHLVNYRTRKTLRVTGRRIFLPSERGPQAILIPEVPGSRMCAASVALGGVRIAVHGAEGAFLSGAAHGA